MIETMAYRAQYNSLPGQVNDVFDGNHYCHLLNQHVVVDDNKLAHHYFADSRDIALGFCTDSYLLFKWQ